MIWFLACYFCYSTVKSPQAERRKWDLFIIENFRKTSAFIDNISQAVCPKDFQWQVENIYHILVLHNRWLSYKCFLLIYRVTHHKMRFILIHLHFYDGNWANQRFWGWFPYFEEISKYFLIFLSHLQRKGNNLLSLENVFGIFGIEMYFKVCRFDFHWKLDSFSHEGVTLTLCSSPRWSWILSGLEVLFYPPWSEPKVKLW